MVKKNEIKIFDDRKVRTLWDAEQEKWYLSIIDVIAVLTDQTDFSGSKKLLEKLEFVHTAKEYFIKNWLRKKH